MSANQSNVESEQRDGSRGESQNEKQKMSGEVGRDLEQIRRLGEERLGDLRELGGEVRHRVEEHVRAKPLMSVGVAFGAGVVISSLFSSRLARLAILAAGGYAAREIFGERLVEMLGPHEEEGEEEAEEEAEGRGESVRRSPRRRRRAAGPSVGPSGAEASGGHP